MPHRTKIKLDHYRNGHAAMAQVTGGSDFDMVWDEWARECLVLLREAADIVCEDRIERATADGCDRRVDVDRH
jgi:hypothetical protein